MTNVNRERILKPLMFLAPAVLIYFYIMIFPTLYSLYLSLHRTSGIGGLGRFVGLGNFKILLFEDPVFWVSLKNNLIWLVLGLVVPVWLGLMVAAVLNIKMRGRILYRSLVYYPSILSLVAVGLIWGWMYNPQLGLINTVFRRLGLPFLAANWLGNARITLFSVFAADTWITVGFAMVLFLGGMQSIPEELYESAKVEGANTIYIFFRITIPLLRETFIVITTLFMIGALKLFDIIFTMTAGGPARSTHVLAIYMYYNVFKFFKMGMGCTIAWMILISVAIIVIPYVLFVTREKYSYV